MSGIKKIIKPKIIFEKMGIENFGSFYKYKELNFSTDTNRNVTLITGEIGTGKTIIFQLFWWVLFPEQKITNKAKEIRFLRSEEVINIVNNKAIKNARTGDEITIKGYIKFNWKNKFGSKVVYEITRTRKYKKIGDSSSLSEEIIDLQAILQYIKDSDMMKIEKDGLNISMTEYLNLINEIFPSAIRNFSFIHGEGMTRILSIENVGILKNSVLTISDHPNIKGLAAFIKVCKEYFDKKRKVFYSENEKLQKKANAVKEAKNKLENLLNQKNAKEDQLITLTDELSDVETELSELTINQERMNDYKKIFEKQSDLKIKKYGKRPGGGKKAIKGIIREREEKIIQYAPYIYLEEAIDLCLFDIAEKRELGIIPGSSVPRQFLKMILERKENCICGTKWTPEMKTNILKLMKTAQDNELIETMNIFEGFLHAQTKRIQEGKKEIQRIQDELYDINSEIKENEEKMSTFERSLSEEERSEDAFKKINSLNNKRDKKNQKIGALDNQIKNLGKKVETQETKIKELEKQYDKLESEAAMKGGGRDAFHYKKMYDRLGELEDLRHKIEQKIADRIREETLIETEYNLIQLVKDPDEWQNITISDKGSGWEINAKFQDTLVKNLSTGMTNILGLSFIFALSSILDVDLPLVFDSPLGNLDGDTREIIAKNLPSIYKGRQIIFFEKKTNLTVHKDNDETIRLYPILKEFIDFEYNLTNPEKIDTKIEEIR